MNTGNHDYNNRTNIDRGAPRAGKTPSGRTGVSSRASQTGSRSTSSRTSSGTGSGRSVSSRAASSRGMSSRVSGASRTSSSRTGTSQRPPGSRQSQLHSHASGSHGGRHGGRRRRRSSVDYRIIAIAGVVLILAITAVVYGMKHSQWAGTEPQSTEETTTEPETELEKQVTVDGIEITGMSRSDARAEILKKYPWAMKVAYNGDTYEVANLMEEKVNALLDEIYTGKPKENYTLDTSGLEDAATTQAAMAAAKWNKEPKNGSISKYDPSSDSFVFEGEEIGIAIDQEKLAADIQAALKSKKFDAQIQASGSEVQPEISVAAAKEKYKTIGTFTTKTTANSKRNTNVRLACEALNGTIVQPGQEISFNETVGERTAAKGYQGAAAYNNGEVVEEIGGGVCQVSTTLYNAVLRAGLKISVRRSHTFEPSYVTPGQDATVSWGGPDFKFINNSNTAIAIKARYADQTCTVSVYGIPILEEGISYSLESKKVADLDPPAPTYEEDQTLQPDEEVQKSAGSRGSRWETRLVIKKGDEVVSREIDHTTTYKGHAPVVRRNTSGVVIPTEGTGETLPGESGTLDPSAQPSEGIPAGPGELTSTQPATQPVTQPVPDTTNSPGNGIPPGGPGDPPSQDIPPIQEPGPVTDPSGQGIYVEPKPE